MKVVPNGKRATEEKAVITNATTNGSQGKLMKEQFND